MICNSTPEQSEQLQKAVKKILVVHRRTKILLLMLGNTFLIAFFVIKYSLKALILWLSYKFMYCASAILRKKKSPVPTSPPKS